MNTKLKNRALVISPQGLGDLIMMLPTFKLLIDNDIIFDVILKNSSMLNLLNELGIFPKNYFFVKNGMFNYIILLYNIRMIKYNYVIPSISVSSKKFLLFYIFAIFNFSNYFNIFKYFIIKRLKLHNVKKNLLMLNLMNILSIQSCLRESRYFSLLSRNHTIHNSHTNPYIIIAPGSGLLESHKRWPHLFFSQICIKVLTEYPELSIIIIGNHDEISLCNTIYNNIVSFDFSFSSKIHVINSLTSFGDVLHVYSNSLIAIVNCNGGSHVAALAGIPIIGLYGPTNPLITGPLTNNIFVVRSDLACSPCYSSVNPFGCFNPVCMSSISVNQVWSLLNKNLQSFKIKNL